MTVSGLSTNPSTNAYPAMQVNATTGSPQQAALHSFTANQAATAKLSKLSGGKHRRRKYRGGQTAVPVPQATMLYSDKSYPSVNDNMKNLAAISNQGAANAAFDGNAAITKGGYRTRKTKNLLWGCYSGGSTFKKSTFKKSTFKKSGAKSKSKSKSKSRKSRKHHKSRK